MDLSGGRPRYRGIRQAEAARGILVAAHVSVLLWIVLGVVIAAIF